MRVFSRCNLEIASLTSAGLMGSGVADQQCEPDATSVACTSPEGRSTGSMLDVAGSASTEGRRPPRILEVTVSSPEDRSTTVVRSSAPLISGPEKVQRPRVVSVVNLHG